MINVKSNGRPAVSDYNSIFFPASELRTSVLVVVLLISLILFLILYSRGSKTLICTVGCHMDMAQHFRIFFFKINFGNLISILWNLEISNFTKFWLKLSKFWRVLFRSVLIFQEFNLHFDQFSKGHCCWTRDDNDPILFLNEPRHVKLWFMIGKTTKIWKSNWLFLIHLTKKCKKYCKNLKTGYNFLWL